ncbi:protein NRT1/ PTR FAMILY 5.5-like [Argentina anserina]|uniref:protein NRT1/ PTR FAMILY 5.5-like n=1 Tax=Argentina anserina TaxID=57926 RepID=UPI0021768F45|nr:protein NRT1/ PTR FAMILY 5.5-like [Potentilla anserina]
MASFKTRMVQKIIWMKIAVLQMTNLLTGYAMSIMITYLNSVWKFNLTDAAAVVNVYAGAVAVMPLGMLLLVDTLIGSYWLIILSSCAYTMGFLLLTMSTPPVLHSATGTCGAYEAECIGKIQKILFYTALPLIALGASSRFMVDAFREEQLFKPLLQSAKKMKFFAMSVCPKKVRLQSFQIMVSSLVLGGTAYVKPWSLRFGFPAMFTLLATVALLTSTILPLKAHRNLFSTEEIISILQVSPICIFLIPIGVVSSLGNTYFTEQASKMNHRVGSLKVSILFLTMPRSLVRTLVRQSKCCTKIITPRIGISLSMALAILCCITAASVENRRLGVVKRHALLDMPDERVPMTMFWLLPQFLLVGGVCGLSEKSIALFYTDVVLRWPKEDVDSQANGISESKEKNNKSPMDQANKVFKPTENNDHEDRDNQEKQESKRIDNDGEGLRHIDPDRAKQKLKRQYIEFFVDALEGVGNIGSVVLVYVVSEIKPTWFQETVNRSRLDNYYWTLAALTAANLLLSIPVIFYLLRLKKEKVNADDAEDDVDLADEEDEVDATGEEFVVEAAAERAEQADTAAEEGKAGASDEEGKVTPMYVAPRTDMAERKEEMEEAKNQLGDMDEAQKKEKRDMNHIINIADELKEAGIRKKPVR